MGQEYFRRPVYTPQVNVDRAYNASTNGVPAGVVVRMHTDGTVRVTTGANGSMGIGISLTSASSGNPAVIRMSGIANVQPSTAALAAGIWVRGSSGPSTGSTAGSVKAVSAPATGSNDTDESAIGFTLTTAAAGSVASTRTVEVFITHSGRVLP